MATNIDPANFKAEVLESSDVVLVDFWAPWCGPCQMLIPTLDELSEELGEGAKIVKVNVDEAGELASEYDVMSIPALKVFKGGEIVEDVVGVKPKEELKAMIDNHR